MEKRIIFIDSRVSGYSSLIASLAAGTDYVVLDHEYDGIEQILSALAGKSGYDSIQIISHGASGEITLGNTLLDSAALYRYAGELAAIGASLSSTGDILLYGCNVGAGDVGQHFVDTLAQLTGADVAASDDVTGNAVLGGDWELEVQRGVVESTVPPLFGFDGKLANSAPSFFLGGIVITDFGFKDDYGRSVAVQSTGIIVVAGTSMSDFAIVEYDINGLIHKHRIDIHPDHNIASSDNAYSIAVGKSGGTYIVGISNYIGIKTTLSYRAFVIVQYPDNPYWAYDGRAYVTAGYGSIYGGSLALNTSGSTIYLTGNITGTDGGVYVTSFKNNGDWSGVSKTFKFDSKSPSVAQSIAVQNDGDVLVAGYCSTNSLNNDFAIVRCNSDLSFDTTFSFDGKVTTDLGGDDYGYSVAVQSDGKILVAGYSTTNGTSNVSYFAIVRYNTNGSLDTTFGSKGFVTTDLGLYNRDFGQSVAVQNDGKILVAGYCYAGYSYGYDFALVRYNSDGSLDTTFDYDGKVITELGGDDYGYSVTVQNDGKILVAGTSLNASTGNNDFALVRYNTDGSLDTTFGANALNGHSIYTERSNAIILDNDVQVFDAELAALDNYGGATLTLERHSGASADDHFSGDGIVAGNANGTVTIADINIGSYTWNSGTLVITFNKSATQLLVNQAMQSLRYANANDAPPSSVQIDWTFSDGDNTGALNTTGSTLVTIISLNDAPTLTVFAAAVDSTAQNITVEISYADLAAQGDEADDDIVTAFIVKSLSTGTLTIGTNATTAMAWNATTNNTIDVTHHAYWTPVTDSIGDLNAFIVVVKDNSGIESRIPVQARVRVTVEQNPPILITSSLADNAISVAVDSTVVLTFSEAAKAGTGNIIITDGSDKREINITDSTQVMFSGETIAINPIADLHSGRNYHVEIASGVIQDLAGNAYVGINDATTLNFATAIQDNGQQLYAINGHSYQLTKASMTWDNAEAEAVAHGGHLVSINSSEENQWLLNTFGGNRLWIGFNDIAQEGSWVWTDGSPKTFTKWAPGEPSNSKGSEDVAELYGLTTSTSYGKWNDVPATGTKYGIIEYATLLDGIAPTLISSTPGNNALNSAVESNIALTFSERVQVGSGNIIITNGTDKRTIAITDSSQVTIADNTVTINPTSNLHTSSNYHVEVITGAITDCSGNAYAGISDATTLDFTTAAPVLDNGKTLSSFNGHSYQLTTVATTWDNAEAEAVAHGGHLASINSAEENQWLLNTFGGNRSWIGFNDIQQEGTWRWTDGSSSTYKNWSPGEPNNSKGLEDVAELYGITASTTYGKWNDVPATGTKYGILEYGTLLDSIAPTLTTFSPADNATAVALDSNIVLTFGEAVQKGTGNIVISNGMDIRTITVSDITQVVINGNTVTINPTANLSAGTNYHVKIDNDAIKDLMGHAYGGISNATTLDFTTVAPIRDNGKTLSSFNGHSYQLTTVATTWDKAEAEAVAHGGHLVSINSAEENQWLLNTFGSNRLWIGFNDIAQEGSWVWTDGSPTTFTKWSPGEPNNSKGLEDVAELYGITTSTSYGKWNDVPATGTKYGIIEYATLLDGIAPTLISSTPGDNALNTAIESNIVLTFSERVQAGSGNIIITDGTETHTIAINDSNQVTIASNMVTINPTNNLHTSSNYHVEVTSGAITDFSGNAYAGISDATTLDFTTATVKTQGNSKTLYSFSEHSYQLTTASTTWDKAEAEAVAHGGHLVSINSAEENQWLLNTFGSNRLWIGYNDIQQEGTWGWTDGSPSTYTKWAPGEPSNSKGLEDVAELYGIATSTSYGKWNDVPATGTKYGIIEYPFLVEEVPAQELLLAGIVNHELFG
jgi:uncharacterized delta-60 repeat protein